MRGGEKGGDRQHKRASLLRSLDAERQGGGRKKVFPPVNELTKFFRSTYDGRHNKSRGGKERKKIFSFDP